MLCEQNENSAARARCTQNATRKVMCGPLPLHWVYIMTRFLWSIKVGVQ